MAYSIKQRIVSIVLLVGLILSLAAPTRSQATELTSSSGNPADKIESFLLADLEQVGQSDFFVWMQEKADLSPAAVLDTKAEKGRFVFETLRAAAERTQKGLRAQLDASGARYESFYIVNAVLVRGGDKALALDLAARPDVEKITANHQYQFTLPIRQPAPENVQAIEPGLSFVNADDVWAMGVIGSGIVLAGNDTGLSPAHPAIARHYRGCLNPPSCTSWDHNYNWWDATDTYPNQPDDGDGHGTHTTGTMVGDDGGSNQVGMAPGAQTIHCKNMTDEGGGDDAGFIECFEWDLAPWDLNHQNPRPDLAPDAVNNSWGYDGGGIAIFQDAINALQAAGILMEFSAGNSGPGCATLGSPGDYANVLTTGSVGHSGGSLPGVITIFSSRGPSSLFPSDFFPDIMAPGENIRSSVPGGDYASMSGTSMSGPHTVGLIGLMWSASPALRGHVFETIQIIRDTAIPLTGQTGSNCGGDYTSGPNHDWGHGTIDAYAAVQAAIALGGGGTLQGTITDSSTTAPISGTSITASLSPTQTWRISTGDSGIYNLLVLSGTYTVTASAWGYYPETIPGVVVQEEMTTTQDLALDPTPSYVVSGTVADITNGWPLYAKVTIPGYPGGSIWTDPATGFYSATLPGGVVYNVQAEAFVEGYLPATVSFGPLSEDTTVNIMLSANLTTCDAPGYNLVGGVCTPQPGGLLVGNVYDLTAFEPQQYAQVSNDAGFTAEVYATPDDLAIDDAFFTLFSPVGSHVFTATKDLYAPDAVTLSIVQGTTMRRDFYLGVGHLTATPEALAVTLQLGETANRTLTLENDGSGVVNFEIKEKERGYPVDFAGPGGSPDSLGLQGNLPRRFLPPQGGKSLFRADRFMVSDAAPQIAHDVLWEQDEPSGSQGISQYFPDQSGGLFSADDFTALRPWLLETIYLPASSGDTGETLFDAESLDWYIYPDAGGKPAGHPLDGLNAETWKFSAPADAPGVIIRYDDGEYGITLDIVAATGVPLHLPAGTYWLVFFPRLVSDDTALFLWDSSTTNGHLSQVIDPTDLFGLDITTWTPWREVGFGFESDLCFRLEGQGSGVPWVAEQPANGAVPVSGSQVVDVSFDATVVGHPGDYLATLRIETGTPSGPIHIPVTMTAQLPAGWGQLQGTVNGMGSCDANPAPLNGATVVIHGAQDTFTTTTDAAGHYYWWLDPAQGALNVTVTDPDHASTQASGIVVNPGITTTADFSLRWLQPCLSSEPTGLQAEVSLDEAVTTTLILHNEGAGAANLSLVMADWSPWLVTEPVSDILPADSSLAVVVTFDGNRLDQPGMHLLPLRVESNDPASPLITVPVTVTAIAPATFGSVQGVVTGLGYCDLDPAPLAGALVTASDGSGHTRPARTRADGSYALWLDQVGGPYTLLASAAEHQAVSQPGVAITAQQSRLLDFDLRWLEPCLSAAPVEIEVGQGYSLTVPMELVNDGAARAEWDIFEDAGPWAARRYAPERVVTVLLLSPDTSEGRIELLLDTLAAYPDLKVTMWDNDLGNPTAAQLSPYDVVMIGNVINWAGAGLDQTSVGNALAGYVDGGGKVLETCYAQEPTQWGLKGRYITEGYSPFTQADNPVWGTDALVIANPTHPILAGVASINDNYGHLDVSLATGAVLLASWGDSGYPAIAINENVVALNQLYFDSADWSGDVGALLHNALLWLGTPPDISWLSLDPHSGILAPDASSPVELTLDASVITPTGTYAGAVRLYSNDPLHDTQLISVTLIVAEPAYGLAHSPDMHQSGPAGGTVSYRVEITNMSNGPLDNFDITLGTSTFPATLSAALVGPLAPGASATVVVTVQIPAGTPLGQQDTVQVTITSRGDGAQSGAITLTTTAGYFVYLPVIRR